MEINNKTIENRKIKSLILDIKKKKELKTIENSLIIEIIAAFFRQNPKILTQFIERKDFEKFKKSEDYKCVLKYSRNILRRSVGVYKTRKFKENQQLLNQIKEKLRQHQLDSEEILELHKKVLSSHRSTKERLEIYPQLYKKIFSITIKPSIILDLGCGLNPISYPWMKLGQIRYYAVDVNEQDLELVKKYFNIAGINGFTKKLNLQNAQKELILKDFPKADVCFLFKVIESLELIKNHKLSEKLVAQIQAKWLVVSFATKTLSGRPMKKIKRNWFEQMLIRLNFKFRIIIEQNEIFYICNKS